MADVAQDGKSEEQPWDGPRYEAALAHFDKLQEQIDVLRGTLPSIVQPLGQPNLSKAGIFQKVKAAAIQSTDDVKSFREAWTSEQTQGLFSKGRESYQKDSDLSKASKVPRYGWDEGQ